MSAVLDLACDLIRRPSVTPEDAGCLEVVGARLAAGWEEIETPAKPGPKQPAEPETEPMDSAPKRQRRKNSEEQ